MVASASLTVGLSKVEVRLDAEDRTLVHVTIRAANPALDGHVHYGKARWDGKQLGSEDQLRAIDPCISQDAWNRLGAAVAS